MPLAAYAELEQGRLRLRALVGNAARGVFVATEVSGAPSDGEALAAEAVAQLDARGARALLQP